MFRSQNAFANAFANRAVRERERRANAPARNPDYAPFREQIRERRANAPCMYLPPVRITPYNSTDPRPERKEFEFLSEL